MSTLSLAMLLGRRLKPGMLLKTQGKPVLKRRNDELQSQKTMDMREVMERLASFGRGEVTEEQVTNSGEIVQVKTKNSDQIRALELIGKRYGAWTDKKEVSGSLEIDVGVGEYDEDD